MPLKAEQPRQRIPIRRIVSSIVLAVLVIAFVLILRKPKPVAEPQPRQAMAANAESFQSKLGQLAAPPNDESSEVRLTAPEIAAAIAQSAGTLTEVDAEAPSADIATGDPTVSEPVVTFEGDQVRGQFVSQLAGKNVYVTVSGRLGAKDGYATFQPTEFKVGDLSVPVALVNDALQKKILEQHDKLKLPDYIGDLRVENGELVITRK